MELEELVLFALLLVSGAVAIILVFWLLPLIVG
jgi:hypothetical protein